MLKSIETWSSIDDMASRKKRDGRGGRREGAGRKPVLKDAERVTVPMEKRDLRAMKKLAAKRGVTTSALIREAVAAFLKRQRKG